MPVAPWDEDDRSSDGSVVGTDAAPLQEMNLRFGLTLPTDHGARAFARLFRFAYRRSAASVRDNVAWLSFVCAAADPHEAAIQAAVAVKTIMEHTRQLGEEQPIEAHFYDARVTGPVRQYDLVQWRTQRAEALAKARVWGLFNGAVADSLSMVLSPTS